MALLDLTSAELGAPTHQAPHRRVARLGLGAEIARLERDLGDLQISSFPHGLSGPAAPVPAHGPRLLALGELEAVRDALAVRVRTAQAELEARGREQEGHRVRLERMLLAPGKHRFEMVSNAQLGEGGCGVWQVRPRLGLIGMLAGWWHVKLSSGCPRTTARRAAPGRPRGSWS